MPNQMPVRQQSSGNRGYISSPNQNQGYQHRKQQPNDLLVNEDKDYSTSPNRNQAYNRSHQPQQQQQVPCVDPGLVHGIPLMNGPFFPLGLPAPYIIHPGYFGQSFYVANQQPDSKHENLPHQTKTENNDANLKIDGHPGQVGNPEQITKDNQTPCHMGNENARCLPLPCFPGPVLWPLFMPQTQESAMGVTDSAESINKAETH